MRQRAVITLALWAALLPARADVAPSPLAAASNPRVMNQKSVDVVMVREDVTVTLWDAFAVVDAVFVMRNEGKTQDMEVGFPGEGVARGQDYSAHQALYGFSAWVDDKPVKSQGVPTEEKIKGGWKGKDYVRVHRETWHTFKASFPAGKPVKLRVRYGVVAQEHYPMNGRVDGAPMDHEAWYILNTGSRWKGPIGDAVVTFKAAGGVDPQSLRMVNHGPVPGLSSPEKYEPYKLAPGAVMQKDGSVVLTRKAWEPEGKDDMQVVFRPDPAQLPLNTWGTMDRAKVEPLLLKELGRN